MRTVLLCTKCYVHELTQFFITGREEFLLHTECVNGEHQFTMLRSELASGLVMDRLVMLMEDLILVSNPIISDSPKTFDTIKKMVFESGRAQTISCLSDYITHEKRLHIDGYIRFRMKDYTEKINTILYSIVRKNLTLDGRR